MFENNNKNRHGVALLALLALSGLSGAAWADAYEDAAKKWIESEFNPSTLTPEQQMEELKWFIKAAEPYRGMEINVASETITTHEYESKVLAKAFSEITGIKLRHDLMQEGDVVEVELGNATTFLSQTLTKMAVGQFDLGPAAAFSLIYFLIILLVSWLFYTAMTHGDQNR